MHGGGFHQFLGHFGTTSGQWTQSEDLETLKFLSQKVYIIRMPTTSDSGQGENQDTITIWRKYELLGKSDFFEEMLIKI